MPAPATRATPGTYIQELPDPRGITGVPTSIAAFVGVTASGPLMQPTLVTSWDDYLRQFGGLAWHAMLPWSVNQFFLEGGTSCCVVRASDLAEATAASATPAGWTVSAATPGTWGNSIAVTVSSAGAGLGSTLSVLLDPATPDALLQDYVRQNGLMQQIFGGKAWLVLEQFAALVPASFAGRINGQSLFVRVPVDASTLPPDFGPTPLQGGTQPRLDFAAATALLGTVAPVSLLAVPDIVTATGVNGQTSLAQQAALIEAGLLYCQGRGSIFYVADAPWGLDVQTMLSFKTGQGTAPAGNPAALTSGMGAIYYPWVYVHHAATATNVPIPPCGPVLGRYAFTDNAQGVFAAPAGVTNGALQTVVGLERQVSSADQDLLNPNGINCLRSFNAYGNVIWGARTLSPDPTGLYLNQRRLGIYVEQSVMQGLQWTVFEPDSPALRSRVVLDVSAFLTTLWQVGGLFGETAAQAFFVSCDESNNPAMDEGQGLLNIDIGMAIGRPAEFSVLRVQTRTAASP